MAALSGDFTLNGQVRNVDILGESGERLRAQPGFVEQDGKYFRIAELTLPVVINDMWTVSP
jgi:hypothetical protein